MTELGGVGYLRRSAVRANQPLRVFTEDQSDVAKEGGGAPGWRHGGVISMTIGTVSPSSCACQPASTPHTASASRNSRCPGGSSCFPIQGEGNISWTGNGFSSVPKPYKACTHGSWAYGYMVAMEIRKQGDGRLEGRASEMERCGQVIAVRRCECCGKDRAESGTFREVKRTCNGRSCPYCSWVRAQERVELLRHAAEALDEVDGYTWQLLTVNPQYDIDRRSWDLSIEGLHARAQACADAMRDLWRDELREPGAAMLRCIEISERGHVHVHAIYYGPKVPKWSTTKVASKLLGRPCQMKVQRIKGGKNGVARAARYAAKSVKGSASAFNEDWLAGERSGRLLDPELAAKWELAAHYIRLSEAYGALRGLQVPRPDEKGGPHDDGDVQCSCGAVGHYKTVYRNVKSYLIECHLDGLPGTEGGSWLPYWMRENVRRKKIRERERRQAQPSCASS